MIVVLRAFASKELKELVRDRFLFFNIVAAPILGALVGVLVISAALSASPGAGGVGGGAFSVALIDLDRGVASEVLRSAVKWAGVYSSVDDALKDGYYVAVLLPDDASESLEDGVLPVVFYVDVKGVLSESGLSGLFRVASTMQAVTISLEGVLGGVRVVESFKLAQDLNIPLAAALAGSLLLLFLGFIAAPTVIQVAALSIAYDREQRTLEMLLSTPMPRWGYLASKLVGITILSLAGLISTLIGEAIIIGYLIYSLPGAFEAAEGPVEGVGPQGLGFRAILSPASIAIIVLSTIITWIYLTSLGLVIGVLASGDSKSGQAASMFAFIALLVAAFPYIALPLELPWALLAALHPLASGPVAYYLYAAYSASHSLYLIAFQALLACILALTAARLMRPEVLLSPPGQALIRLIKRGGHV